MAREERIVAGIVARGGSVFRAPMEFQIWVQQSPRSLFSGNSIDFRGVPSEFTIPSPTGEELDFVKETRSTRGLAILNGRVDNKLLEALEGSPTFHRLLFYDCSIGDDELGRIVGTLKNPGKLGTIVFRGTRLTDQGLGPLSQLSGLYGLVIEKSEINASGVLELTAKRLSFLSLKDSRCTDAQLMSIVKRWEKSLQTLDLTNTQITDEGLRSLISLPKLRNLRVGGTSITVDGMRDFLKKRNDLWVRKIEQLSLSGLPWGVKDLVMIEVPFGIRELDLSGWKFSDSDVETLSKFYQIETLNLSGTGITDAGVSALYESINPMRLLLRRTAVSGEVLKIFLERGGPRGGMPHLAIGETRVQFADIVSYSGHRSGGELDLSGMQVTEEELRSLASQWRGLRVIFEDREFSSEQ